MLAPHPDDEVLGATTVLEAATRASVRATVVIATDGEAGRDHSGRPQDLPSVREAESLRALGRIGVPEAAVHFLHYPDSGLGAAWSEQWTAKRRDGSVVSGANVLTDLEAAMGEPPPTTIVLPSVLDAHEDHRALARFGLLALLATRSRSHVPHVLGYLIHGGRGWPAHPAPDPCANDLFPWVAATLDRNAVREKAALIREYETQVGPRLLTFARATEPFTVGLVVRTARPSGTAPHVRRTRESVLIDVPRTRCVFGTDPAGRLRLRFVAPTGIDERLVMLGSVPTVVGGRAGEPLSRADDVRVESTTDGTRLVLARRLRAQRGALLEVLPGAPGLPAPAWLLLW